MQDPSSVYVNTTYSPTPKMHNILTEIVSLIGRGYALDTADFETAYLNAPIDGKVFMILDADTTRVLMSLYLKSGKSYVPFLDDKDRMIVMVNKAIHGLQQSA